MYTSKINIKHNRNAEIHWGVHKLTNELVWIDDVEGNGFSCNCKCACCGSDLKAVTQGKIQKHHFKHRGNNGCYYSDEIAEYLKAKEILSSISSMWIPPIALRIGPRPQIIQTKVEASIDSLYCSHDANHYPPLLVVNINQRPTRIILSFKDYYTSNDYRQLVADAIENNWDCLEILLPRKNDSIVVTKELLYEYVSGIDANKRWIFNSKLNVCAMRLKQAMSKLTPSYVKYGGITKTEYACPLHKREFNGSYYAYKNDCEECDFHLSFRLDNCLCLAEAYIKNLEDFDIPENIRGERFVALQHENEEKWKELQAQIAASKIGGVFSKRQNPGKNNLVVLNPQKAKESFCKQLCPCCEKRLHKNEGKHKTTWLCLTPNCEFYVVEDIQTGEIKMLHKGNEV